jgi:hypothetical protein
MDKVIPVRKEKASPALDKAKDFLTKELSANPVNSEIIKKRASDAGISEATLRRAKKKLKVESKKIKNTLTGSWVLRLPDHSYEVDIREAEKNKLHDFYFK